MSHGLLIINLGTPSGPDANSVRRYLREFLTDKRVIDLPAPLRYLLVYAFILPFRPQKSALAYQAIWTKEGSPLLLHSKDLEAKLQQNLGADYTVALAMRYGNPSIKEALERLKNCKSLTILPLYPQYSSAATGSSLEEVLNQVAVMEVIPSLAVINNFYKHPAYIKAQAQIIKAKSGKQDYLLFSYHGIPERQITKSGCTNQCTDVCPPISLNNKGCYRAQCYETSRLLAQELQLNDNQYGCAFQSRLGKAAWIKPYTDELLTALAQRGIKNLTMACPSFVTDCLETLEEIGIRAKQHWFKLGGEQFTLIPCMNSDPMWINAITEITVARISREA